MGFARSDWGAVTVAACAAAFALWLNAGFVHDDAFISLRYARNLIVHGQLVWTLGEYNEGYTNLLFVLLSAGLMKAGLDPVVAVRLLGLFGIVMVILATARASLVLAPERPLARAAIVVSAGATPALSIWALGGLEAAFLAGLIALACLGLVRTAHSGGLRPLILTSVAFSMAILTRLDSSVFIGTAALAAVALPIDLRHRLVAALMIAGPPLLIALMQMIWRHWYYGELFPLTFYAKTGFDLDHRLRFVPDYLSGSLLWLPSVGLGLLATLALLIRGPRTLAALLGLPVAASCGYVVWAGGDHMVAARLFVPLITPAVLVTLAALNELRATPARRLAAICALITFTPYLTRDVQTIDPAALYGGVVGAYVDAEFPKDQLIALHTAGSTPFFAPDHRFIDMAGLNDPVIAHRSPIPDLGAVNQPYPGHGKGDGAYVLSRQPNVIIAGQAKGNPVSDHLFVSDVELEALPGFAACYRLETRELAFQPRDAGVAETALERFTFTYYVRTCE